VARFQLVSSRLGLEMSSGLVAYELLAGQAGLLLTVLVTVGLSVWLVSWRPGSRCWARIGPPPRAAAPTLAERLVRPVQVPRQLDPDAWRGHRPRAPSLSG
jgi:hypothetical protein